MLLLARSETALRHTQGEVQRACTNSKQIVDAIPVDLTKPDEVVMPAYPSQGILANRVQIHAALNHYHTPDILICTAGGTPTQVGFLADISPEAITSCVDLNYYTTIFIVQYCLKLWLAAAPTPSPRHVLLTSSLAAFLGIPGFIAYTPTKVAIRSLADTLRQEFLLYGDNTFKVHVSFPGPFITEAFLEEQDNKPNLTKAIEGTNLSRTELEQKIPPARAIAKRIIAGVEKGKTYVPVDWTGDLLFNNMRGPSPRFWTLWDFLLGIVAACAWWFYRTSFDRQTRRFGVSHGRNNQV